MTSHELIGCAAHSNDLHMFWSLLPDNCFADVQMLVEGFNVAAADGVMCRNTVNVGWDGRVFDCDFNQQLDMGIRYAQSHAKFGQGIASSLQCRHVYPLL